MPVHSGSCISVCRSSMTCSFNQISASMSPYVTMHFCTVNCAELCLVVPQPEISNSSLDLKWMRNASKALMIWIRLKDRMSKSKVRTISFFPRASERRVLLIVGSVKHLHIFTSSHPHILTSSHPHVFTSSHPHIFTSSHLHIFTSSHVHINLHIFQFSLALLHSCPLALLSSCSLALLLSCPLALSFFSIPESVWAQGSSNSGGLYLIFSSSHLLLLSLSHSLSSFLSPFSLSFLSLLSLSLFSLSPSLSFSL